MEPMQRSSCRYTDLQPVAYYESYSTNSGDISPYNSPPPSHYHANGYHHGEGAHPNGGGVEATVSPRRRVAPVRTNTTRTKWSTSWRRGIRDRGRGGV